MEESKLNYDVICERHGYVLLEPAVGVGELPWLCHGGYEQYHEHTISRRTRAGGLCLPVYFGDGVFGQPEWYGDGD